MSGARPLVFAMLVASALALGGCDKLGADSEDALASDVDVLAVDGTTTADATIDGQSTDGDDGADGFVIECTQTADCGVDERCVHGQCASNLHESAGAMASFGRASAGDYELVSVTSFQSGSARATAGAYVLEHGAISWSPGAVQ